MTYEQRERIKAHMDELCEWLDEQECHETSFQQVSEECDYWHDLLLRSEQERIEIKEQRDTALKKLDETEAKVNLLKNYLDTYIDFLCAVMDYEDEAGNVRAYEDRKIELGPAVSAKVALVQLFKDDDTAKVIDSVELYERLAQSYRRLAANL